MTIAVGTKKKTAAITHKLIEDVPLCAAAAIQRGPSTVAMLKNSTSQKPISLRNCAMGLALGGCVAVIPSPAGSQSYVQLGDQLVFFEEELEERIIGMFEVRPGTEKSDLAVLQKNNTIGQTLGQMRIMRHDDRSFVERIFQAQDQVAHVPGHDGIDHGSRLVV